MLSYVYEGNQKDMERHWPHLRPESKEPENRSEIAFFLSEIR